MLPATVAVGASGPCDPAGLHPSEAACIARALPARQREFAGGRAGLRAAQSALKLAPLPVPMGPDRAPLWPPGLRGSLTHAQGLCLAVLTADPGIRALGLDLEADAPLPPEVLAEVVQPDDGDLPPPVVFSVKEAVFKALYPQVRQVFGFDAVRVSAAPGGFRAETRLPLGPLAAGARVSGRLWRGEGLILTVLCL